MTTEIHLNMVVTAENRELLNQIQALVANAGGSVGYDRSFSFDEREPVADGRVVFLTRDSEADALFLMEAHADRVVGRLNDELADRVRAEGVVVRFINLPCATWEYDEYDNEEPRRYDAYVVEQLGFTHAPHGSDHQFNANHPAFNRRFDEHEEEYVLAVVVPADLYELVKVEPSEVEYTIETVMIEESLCGHKLWGKQPAKEAVQKRTSYPWWGLGWL